MTADADRSGRREAPTARPPTRPYVIYASRIVPVPANGLVVGRSKMCGLVVDDPGCHVSKRHLRIARDGHWLWAEQLGSTESLLNGREDVSRAARTTWLADADRLRLGGHAEIVICATTGPRLIADGELRRLADAVMAAGPGPARDDIFNVYCAARGATLSEKTFQSKLRDLADGLAIAPELRGTGRSRSMVGAIYQQLVIRGRPSP